MKKTFGGATARDLTHTICNMVLEDKVSEFWRSDTCDKLFDAIWEAAKGDAQLEQAGIAHTIEHFPYLKDLYHDVSPDASRRAIYHEAAIKCHPQVYKRKYLHLEELVDKIYQASPMFVFVSSSDMSCQANKEAVESAATIYKQKINSMVHDWATAVYEKAFWSEVRKVIAEAMR